MNWQAIGAVGEVGGAIAVVATLGYLAVQLRQSNRHAEATSETAFFDAWNDILSGWIADEETRVAIRKGLKDFDALTKSQQAVFHMRVGAAVNHWILAGRLTEKGLLAPESHQMLTKLLISVLSTPGGMQYWERDAALTPGGSELLALVRSSEVAPIFEHLPWWSEDDE